MTVEPRIVPIEPDLAGTGRSDGAFLADSGTGSGTEDFWDSEDSHVVAVPRFAMVKRISAVLAVVALLGWTGFFIWSRWEQFLVDGTVDEWINWIIQWSMPSLLCLGALLLATRERRRGNLDFTETGRSLLGEARLLEERLETINGKILLARDYIATQSHDIEALGQVTADRLFDGARQFGQIVAENQAKAEAVALSSNEAVQNMEKLRGQLPGIVVTASEVTKNIANAGRTAHLQLEDMVAGFHRLNEFGLASGQQVHSIRAAVAAAADELGNQLQQLGEITERRFAALLQESETHRQRLEQDELSAVSALRNRASAIAEEVASLRAASELAETQGLEALRLRLSTLRDESARISAHLAEYEANALSAWSERSADMEAQIARHREAAETVLQESAENMARRLAELERVVSAHQQQQLQRVREVATHCAEIEQQVASFSTLIQQAASYGSDAGRVMDTALSQLDERLATGRAALSATQGQVADLTQAGARLLELIEASRNFTASAIPEALGSVESGLSGIEQRVEALRGNLNEAGETGRSLSDDILRSRSEVAAAADDLVSFQRQTGESAAAQERKLLSLREQMEQTRIESVSLVQTMQASLDSAIARLAQAARKAGEEIDAGAAERIAALAESLGHSSKAAIASIVENEAAQLAATVEATVNRVSGHGHKAAEELRGQLAQVDQLASNLESRISLARERALDDVDSDFARRVAIITESLNSTAINITKAMSTDVADTSWAAYMRGDRGVFTRRAVSLLDNSEAKAVLHQYERNRDFRDHVNHYIHDFEAMLRQVLSTRDGNSLGVTLLSSDMGKLYVALAQAIERLRT